jgi:hypothetical protein
MLVVHEISSGKRFSDLSLATCDMFVYAPPPLLFSKNSKPHNLQKVKLN